MNNAASDTKDDSSLRFSRLLRNFALSMIVPDRLYKGVSDWVEANDLKGRLVYYRVSEESFSTPRMQSRSLAGKLSLKDSSPYFQWLRREIISRFDFVCCETMEEFRREPKAITVNGQTKSSGKRHEKDDRYKLNDRSRYLLGWNNAEKIKLLERQAASVEKELAKLEAKIKETTGLRRALEERARFIVRLADFESFEEIDWHTKARDISDAENELKALHESSQRLKTLKARQAQVKADLKAAEKKTKRQ